MCPLWSLFSVHISLNVIVKYTWNTMESSRIRIWKAYCTRFEITQNVRILTVFWNLCRYAISVYMYMFCCNEHKLMKLSMKNGFYFSTSTFVWARETIKSNVKLKPSIHKYPTSPVWHKYHLWMLILKRNDIFIQVLGCNMHFSDILCI